MATPFADLVSITPTAAVDLKLPLNITNTATNFSLANFGRPVISVASQNIFGGSPDVLVDIELGPMLQDQTLSLLASLDAAADDISSRSALNQEIPGIGRSLNGILNESSSTTNKRWGDLVKFEKAASDYFESFNPSSANYNATNVGKKPTVLGLRNAITVKIEEVTKGLFGSTSGSSPVSFKGGIDLAANRLMFDLVVNGNFTRAVDLKLDTLGSQWNNIGVSFNANAKVNVLTTVDLGLSFGMSLSQASGVDPFFTLNRFNLSSAISGDGSTLGFSIGNGTIGGTISATKLRVNAGASIAIANTAGLISNRVNITPTGSLDLDFAFNASLYGANLVVGTSTLPSVQVVDTNLFDTTSPVFTLNVAPLLLNLSSEAVVSGLLGLATWLNNATGSSALSTKIPLLNKTVGELLSKQAEPSSFDRSQIIAVTSLSTSGGFKRFTTQLNLGGKTAASIGIKPEDKMRFLATSGEFYEGTIDSVVGEVVTIRYADTRPDSPNVANPSLTFQVGGTLGDNLKAALVNYNKPGIVAPSLGQLFNELAEPLGISFTGIAYDNATKLLTLTPTFAPRPIQYTSKLDFGNRITGLEFNASGNFLVTASPTIKLPLEINLDSNSGLTPGNRVSIIDSFGITGATNAPSGSPIVITTTTMGIDGLRDGQMVTIAGVLGNTNANGSYFAKRLSSTTFQLFTNSALTIPREGNGNYTGGGTWSFPEVPEISIAISAQLDNPQARASLGFFSVSLGEDPAVATPNDGVKFDTVLGINIKDPGTVSGTTGRATITELTTSANLLTSFDPTFTGSFDIDGLTIRPEVAGTAIPGQVTIFSTNVANPIATSTRTPAQFASLAELGTVFNKIYFDNTIGTTESLTPEAIATMFVQLGTSVQNIAGKLDVPDGIPFVKDAISGIIDFSKTTQNFARQLYFNPKLIGTNDIAITNGRLSSDATFAIRIEGGEPSFITIPPASTATNSSIDDLYADINAALVAQGFGSKLIAERQLPYSGGQISSLAKVTTALPNFVQTLPAGFERWVATLPNSVNLYNLGLRVGDVIEYRDTSGRYQKASVDQMTLNTLTFRLRPDSLTTPTNLPDTTSNRSIALFGTTNANKLAIRTTDPTAGISLELSTVQVTAVNDLPTQLTTDLAISFVIDGTTVVVPITAASTANNGQPSEMLASVNQAFANTTFGGGKLNQKLRARLEGTLLRIFAIDSVTQSVTINGGTILGFTAGQTKDANTARTELGLGDSTVQTGNVIGFRDGMLASPSFRANTVQDLVHVINGMIQAQFAGQTLATASLNYIPADVPTNRPRSVQFNINLGTQFTKSVDLNFDAGLNVGFAQLSVAGGAAASFTANAGVNLTVGVDLDPIGSGTVSASTLLSTLNQGRGAQFKVGMFGSAVNSSGKNSPATDLTLNVAVNQFGGNVTNISVTVPAAKVGDNTSLSDLAQDLTDALKALSIAGLPVVNDIPPIEVQATSDGRLYLLANASKINGLTISTGTSLFLGFTAAQSSGAIASPNVPDLTVKLRNGNTFNVNLDFSETLGDIKSRIETAAGGASVLEVTFVEDRVQLKDKTTLVGTNKFRVSAVGDNNGVSPIGSLLGIVQEAITANDDPNTPANDAKDGTIIDGGALLKRLTMEQFYVLASGSSAYANVTINSTDINLIASLGILDLGIKNGVLNFTANASVNMVDIDDPETPVNEALDGKLRLGDFSLAGLKSAITPSFTYGGTANLPIDGTALVFLPPAFQQGGATPMNIGLTLSGSGFIKPTLTYGVTNFQAALESFKNFSFADLVGVIQRVVELLQSSDISGLNTPIPVINKTPNDILDVVGGLSKAAEELLKGPDLTVLNARILELETLVTKLAGTPSQNNAVKDQIAGVKSAANPNHAYQVSLTQAPTPNGITPNDIPLGASAADVFDELTRVFGAGVVKSVTGSKSGPYTVTFEASRGNVDDLKGASRTGLTVQSRTLTQGVLNTTSEVQQLTFVSTGQLVAAATRLRNTVASIPVTTEGQAAMLAKVGEIQDSIASRSSLGKIIGDAIKKQLNLPANAFTIAIDFQDADAALAGFQATAIVKIDIDKTVTKSYGFDFNLPDLGPIDVTTGGSIAVSVGGHLDLDFGFRFGTFTPYLLSTTGVQLTTSIDSNVSAQAGIAGISGGLTGKLQLKGATFQNVASGQTSFTLASAPTDNLVVISRSGVAIGATNASTIVITSSVAHGLRDGQQVSIDGVLGNTNANGKYFAKVLTSTTFSLFTNKELTQARAGNAAYTSGGSWSVVLTRGSASTLPNVDYSMSTANPPVITFKNATTATTRVEYSLASAVPSAVPASASFTIDPFLTSLAASNTTGDGNTIGGIPFSQVFATSTPIANKFDFSLNGIASASLSGNFAGVNVPNAVAVVVSLNQPTNVDLNFDGVKNYIASLTDPSKLNITQLISGVKAILSMIESGMKSDLLEKLPLIGSGVDLTGSFVGKLRTMINQLDSVVSSTNGSIEAVRASVQQSIFNSLGPAGLKILKLNPLYHDDPNVANDVEVADQRDVEISIPSLTTPIADAEFGINLRIAGSDTIDASFDLGVDAVAFELATQGGVQLRFGYDFSFGFGVSLQNGFYFQLKPNATYTDGIPAVGSTELGVSLDVILQPGTSLSGKLFILNVSATSNLIEDYNRDGILNDGGTGIDPGKPDSPSTGLTRGPVLNEAIDGIDYNRDGDTNDVLSELDADKNGRLSKGTGLSGNLFVDINNPDNDAKNRLSFAEIKQNSPKTLFNAGITTEAYADLRLRADVSSSSLPNITADLTLDWALGLTTRDGLIGGGLPDIALRDVNLDMGSFLTTVVRPVFESLKTYLGPIRPLIDFLASPVPGLNDLSQLLSGPEITFVSLGMIGASANEKTRNAARKAQQVIGLMQEIFKFMDSFEEAVRDGDSIVINFGTYYVTGKPTALTGITTIVSGLERILPSNAKAGSRVRVFSNGTEMLSNTYKVVRYKDAGVSKTKIVFNSAPTGTITAAYTTSDPVNPVTGALIGTLTDLTNKNTPVQVKTNSLDGAISSDPNSPNSVGNKIGSSGKAGAGKTKSLLGKLSGAADANGKGGFGLKIPLITEPSNIFKLFTGEKADIVQWSIPKLDLNVPFSMRFGPIPFPPVPLYATFNAKLNAFADFSVGFDTRGIAKTGNFIDGFYFGDLANVTSGADIDEFGISLEASVGAVLDLYFVQAGIEGGVRADLGFNWNDLDKDGKIYLDELKDLFNLRPTPDDGSPPGSCVFDAHGSITAFIRAYYDVWLFGGDSFTIAEFKLFEFNHSCVAPGLGDVSSDGTLTLYAGENAGKRGTLYGTDPNETFEIRQVIDEKDNQPAQQVTFRYRNRDNAPDTTTRLYKGNPVKPSFHRCV